MTENEVEKLLWVYTDLILKCENRLKEVYHLKSIPYLHQGEISKKAELYFDGQILTYNFHGSGCTFILGTVHIDYDIYVDRPNYMVTSPFSFKEFINSYLKSGAKISENEVADHLERLRKKGIINKVYPDYLVYEVNFDWYGNNAL